LTEQEYTYLKRKVLKLTNINLDNYKSQQMRRRLDGFFAHIQAKTVVDYCHILERDPDMLEELRNFLTINVSEFFRDMTPFEQLRKIILPKLLKNTHRLNIWSAGCSHGQEPYSIAIILENIFPFHSHRILATDIDMDALRQARAGGPYSADDVKSVPPTLIRKYFSHSHGDYRVVDRIRHRVEFRQQNLLCDNFEKGFDLIICRNVTIYFTEEAKKELNKKFYQALKDGGVLFIGGTEVMLDVTSVGFKGLLASFYQKPESTVAKKPEIKERMLLQI
jgi:chemotaxis protein methyltransferase CheR